MSENFKIKLLLKLSLAIAVVYAVCFCNNHTGIAYAVFGIFFASMLWWLIVKKKCRKIGFWDISYGLGSIFLNVIPAISANEFVFMVSRLLLVIILIKWTIHISYNVEKIEFIQNISIIIDFIFSALSQIFAPLTDVRQIKGTDKAHMNNGIIGNSDNLTEEKLSNKMQIIIGIAISLPILFVVLELLASADVVFKYVITGAFVGTDNIQTITKLLFTALVAFLISYCCGKALLQRGIRVTGMKIKKADTVVGITFSGIFSAVYLLFCIVQIAALVNTSGTMLPNGYTYAKYARTGFFQLMVVCLINICMVIACRLKFNMNGILQKLLTIISACTYIMTASSAYRMVLYIQNYNLTFLRILVLWILIVIAVLMVFVIWFIYDEEIKLFEYGLLSVTILFLIFAFIKPDNMIAKYNLQNFESNVNADAKYLINNLSLDAADTIISNEISGKFVNEEIMTGYCKSIVNEYENCYKNDFRKFNWSRYQAYKKAKEYLKLYNTQNIYNGR